MDFYCKISENPLIPGSGHHLTIIYKIIYPLEFYRKKQENLTNFDNKITRTSISSKIQKSPKSLDFTAKNPPVNLSTGGSFAALQGFEP